MKRFVLYDRVTLTDAQIKALPTTGIALIPLAGVGFMAKFLSAEIQVNATAGAYTNIDPAAVIQILNGAQVVSQAVSEPANGGVTALFGASDTKVAILGQRSSPFFTLTEGTPNTIAGRIDAVTVETKTNMGNKALTVKATNGAAGNFTGGNAANFMTIDVVYLLLPL